MSHTGLRVDTLQSIVSDKKITASVAIGRHISKSCTANRRSHINTFIENILPLTRMIFNKINEFDICI